MAQKNIATELPHNSDAERAVLGCSMLRPEYLYNVLSSLDEDDFFEGKHKIIYRALVSLEKRHVIVDVLTVSEELNNLKELENVGGVKYLQECTESMAASIALDFYVGIVKDQSVLRKMLLCIRKIDNDYKTQEIENVNNFIAESEMAFKDAVKERKISTFSGIEEIANRVQLQLNDTVVLKDDDVVGLSTGYRKLNYYTQGFKKGEMIVVAARPSVGKTALALNLAYKAASIERVPVAIFSLEMNSEQLVRRLIASESYVNLKQITSGNLNPKERVAVQDAIKKLSKTEIFIDDSPNIKLMDIIAKSRKLKASKPNLGLIIIDYLGLVTLGGAKTPDARNEQVRQISLAVKGLAKELQVPIICVSQLSRTVEQRGENKRPMLSDLRDSGSVEQDADIVMLLFRKDYYDKFKEPDSVGTKKLNELSSSERSALTKEQKEKALNESIPGGASLVEVNVAKNRNGQTGIARLFFLKDFGRFDSPAPEWEEEMRKIENGE